MVLRSSSEDRPSWRSWMRSLGMKLLLEEHRRYPMAGIDRPKVRPLHQGGQGKMKSPLTPSGLYAPTARAGTPAAARGHQPADQQPQRNAALGALSARVPSTGQRALEDGLDAVGPTASSTEFLAGHACQLLVVTHRRSCSASRFSLVRLAPIHNRHADDGDHADDPNRHAPPGAGQSHPARSHLDLRAFTDHPDVGDDVPLTPPATAVGRRTWACSAGRSASRCRSGTWAGAVRPGA